MVKTRVKGWIFNIEDINKMYEYYLKIFNSKSKDIIVRLEDIKQLSSELEKTFIKMEKTSDYLFDDERPETEEEAKQVLGQEFIKGFENIRRKCDKDGITLAIHGTDTETAELIQNQGLLAKTSYYCDTMVKQKTTDLLPEYDDYSGLLNWEHRLYKGLVLIGIPKDCLTINSQQIKPLWEKLEGDHKDTDLKFRIKPEFIIGYLDIDQRKFFQNDLYRVQHNYEGLINDTRSDERLINGTRSEDEVMNQEEAYVSEVPFPDDIDEDRIKIKFKHYADVMFDYLRMIKSSIDEAENNGYIVRLQNGNIAVPPRKSLNINELFYVLELLKKLEDDVISLTFEENLEKIIHNTSTHEINNTTKILSELGRDDKELEDEDLIL